MKDQLSYISNYNPRLSHKILSQFIKPPQKINILYFFSIRLTNKAEINRLIKNGEAIFADIVY